MSGKDGPEQFVVNAQGKPKAVILSFVNYQKLLRLAEDRDDVRALRHSIRTNRGFISHPELVKRLRRQGLL